ncbi:hypothetical protein [Endozoicomonas sp. SCSIO W0465]|uniref:hypothetical protein n=1 Tax=Endozoicomonas sp. SCSIO W0465 TaxID=2918516 RepID=UPI002075DC78|nr:hypothetical protein [Endozoicomonas sp. SCSIO W0465]USE36432.1 hypothetical protein MJO57_31195 [Endozoicomonas sp. SCSIO W0465]
MYNTLSLCSHSLTRYDKNTNMHKIPEPDWKVVKKLHPIILQRYCQQVFEDVQALTKDDECDYHDAYQELYDLVHNRNKAMRDLFDGLTRSKATLIVLAWKNHALITDDEFSMLSEDTQALVDHIHQL